MFWLIMVKRSPSFAPFLVVVVVVVVMVLTIFVSITTLFIGTLRCCCWIFGRRRCYNGRVKLAGNRPFLVVPSFVPINQPSSFKRKKRWFTILLSMNFDKYLIFWIIVLNDMDGIAHFKAQFVHIFLYIFVRRFDTIKNTWWQLGSI